MATAERWAVRVCPACRAQVAPGFLTCPACHALVYSEDLKGLAEQAERASQAGQPREALTAWRDALLLLPADSSQSKRVGEKIATLSREVEALPIVPTKTSGASGRKGWLALGTLGLLLWKFKFILVFVLSKAKLLALGLGKSTTLFSMLASAAVYWTIFGWKFAFGLVGSIYIHEMGHVAALEKIGIKATAPMFIPGFGAFVRMKQYPASAREDAYVGLAGPIWGMGAALACLLVWWATGSIFWAALAEWGARINLFNLTPIASLDGDRGFRALSRVGRGAVLAVVGTAVALTGEAMLWVVLVVGVVRAFGEAPATSDRRALVQFLLLVAVLSAIASFALAQMPPR